MIIEKFERIDYGNIVKYKTYVQFKNDSSKKILWFKIDEKDANYFSDDRIDGIVVMLLFELLKRGEDVFSKLPISEKLYFTLNIVIEKLVSNSNGSFSKIDINCPLIDDVYERKNRKNAVGMSFGVDSLYSYFRYRDNKNTPKNYLVNLITYFNHGALNGEYKNDQLKMRTLYLENKKRVEEFAKHEEIDCLFVDTNLDEICSINYTNTHTFRTVGIALLFQKLIKNYYYSSAGEEVFEINPLGECGKYDVFSLPNLQTESTNFFSCGIEKNRFEKTQYLTDYDFTKKILSVCWKDIDNCGYCPKCIRTLATFEILGCIDEYKDIFDISKYRENYVWNWAKIISLKKTDYFYKEIYEYAKLYDFKINKRIIFLSKIFMVSRKIFDPKLLNNIQKHIKKGKL